MMKATGLKRGSRKKPPQQESDSSTKAGDVAVVSSSSAPSSTTPKNISGAANGNSSSNSNNNNAAMMTATFPQKQTQQQPARQQQHRRQMDEVTALTTKNYRLAKELADLRVRFRDEQKSVTRLTMENMNLASRCREAISHVAMLKRELEQQQKRTADALASQREQTQRMADTLSTSMELSRRVSPASSRSSSSQTTNDHDQGTVSPEDVDMSCLVSATPSPLRSRVGSSSSERHVSSPDYTSSSGPTNADQGKDTAENASEKHAGEKFVSFPPNSMTSNSPRRELLASMNSVASVVGDESSPRKDESSGELVRAHSAANTKENDEESDKQQNDVSSPMTSGSTSQPQKQTTTPAMYSTPKRSDRTWAPTFHIPGDEDDDDNNMIDGSIFRLSTSPQQPAGRAGHKRETQSYNEEFPSDMIDGHFRGNISPFSSTDTDSVNARQVNLVNSVDDFEKSFATDFPDSFTPKEAFTSTRKSSSAKDIYNPFFATPERSTKKNDWRSGETGSGGTLLIEDASSPDGRLKTGDSESSSTHQTPEEKKSDEVIDSTPYETPPRNGDYVSPDICMGSDPGRPEKTMSSAARARYERALQPRKNTDWQSSVDSGNGTVESDISHDEKIDSAVGLPSSMSSKIPPSLSQIEDEVSPQRTKSDSVLDIVDAYENSQRADNERRPTPSVEGFPSARENTGVAAGPSIAARLSGVRSLRRNVKQPISYAEPALNTKLRRGDKFFPKSSSPASDAGSRGPGLVTPDGSPVQTITI